MSQQSHTQEVGLMDTVMWVIKKDTNNRECRKLKATKLLLQREACDRNMRRDGLVLKVLCQLLTHADLINLNCAETQDKSILFAPCNSSPENIFRDNTESICLTLLIRGISA